MYGCPGIVCLSNRVQSHRKHRSVYLLGFEQVLLKIGHNIITIVIKERASHTGAAGNMAGHLALEAAGSGTHLDVHR